MIRAFTHIQAQPALTWTITHPFDDTPVGDVTTTVEGQVIKALPLSIKRISGSQLMVEFSSPTAGQMRLVGNIPNVTTGTGGMGSIDPGAVAPPPIPFDFFDSFAGTAGSLDTRVPSGDTRAWAEFSAGLNLDGAGHLVNDEALLFTAPTIQLPLATSITRAFSIEVVFASALQSAESVNNMTFDVGGDDYSYSLNFVADAPSAGDLLIEVGGADSTTDHSIMMPAVDTPLTVKVELAGGTCTLFVNSVQVATGTISTALGQNVKLSILSSGDNLASNTVLVDSIAVTQMPGNLL